jgi:hypothetical protein
MVRRREKDAWDSLLCSCRSFWVGPQCDARLALILRGPVAQKGGIDDTAVTWEWIPCVLFPSENTGMAPAFELLWSGCCVGASEAAQRQGPNGDAQYPATLPLAKRCERGDHISRGTQRSRTSPAERFTHTRWRERPRLRPAAKARRGLLSLDASPRLLCLKKVRDTVPNDDHHTTELVDHDKQGGAAPQLDRHGRENTTSEIPARSYFLSRLFNDLLTSSEAKHVIARLTGGVRKVMPESILASTVYPKR